MFTTIVVLLLFVNSSESLSLPQKIVNTNNNVKNSVDGLVNRRDALLTSAASAAAAIAGSGLFLPQSALAEGESPSAPAPVTAINLGNGVVFPLISFGLQIYDDDTAYKLTLTALEVGYRNFFASVLARNQKGFARAVRDSGIPREDLCICGSVVSNRANGYNAAKAATAKGCDENMKAFAAGNIDYLDMIMLDYPGPDRDSIRGQWKAFEEMYESKLVKSLAVSNFKASQLDDILVNNPELQVKPVVNQLPFGVAYHPGNVVEENAKRGILVQAWAPLGGSLGGRFDSRIKTTCTDISPRYNKSGAQVALKWVLQSGAAVCTQTKKKSHFVEDLDLFDFQLSGKDMATLNGLTG